VFIICFSLVPIPKKYKQAKIILFSLVWGDWISVEMKKVQPVWSRLHWQGGASLVHSEGVSGAGGLKVFEL
jgi:hypothetical protein